MRNKDDYYKPLTDRPRRQEKFSNATRAKILIVFTVLILSGVFWWYSSWQQNLVKDVILKDNYLIIEYPNRKITKKIVNYQDIKQVKKYCDKGGCGLFIYPHNGEKYRVNLHTTSQQIHKLYDDINKKIQSK